MATDSARHAVVVGAGVSGLLAAHVLASRFERVTVVERDAFADGTPAFRSGVPQSRHVHILWSRGQAAVDALLPGAVTDLEAAGATVVRAPDQMRWLSPARWFADVPGAHYLSASRELLESTLRRRVGDHPAIAWMPRHEVTALVPGRDGAAAVSGVRLRERGNGGQERRRKKMGKKK